MYTQTCALLYIPLFIVFEKQTYPYTLFVFVKLASMGI
ncbi:MAG: hypothetical protein HPY66_1537 [Firmicutes bacterium]|nr:hypothetical protein [Bacillota bacterium]